VEDVVILSGGRGIADCTGHLFGSAQGAESVLGEAMRSLLEAKSKRQDRVVARTMD
jgi:hypothetical protein